MSPTLKFSEYFLFEKLANPWLNSNSKTTTHETKLCSLKNAMLGETANFWHALIIASSAKYVL